ncbi:MAG: CDP-alcohol phosphatidyltransferase family protein [Planctomycetota bacterium]|jgi:CDP-diacylglycerol--serine O-phosphatidyltransferase
MIQKIKTKTARKRLLRRVRKQQLKNITVLPSLVTLLNGACGFAAIVFAAKAGSGSTVPYQNLPASYFSLAGYMILLAMVADMFDGRLARISQSTSSFGGQLDSLCDMISFGVAPAFLMLKILEYKIHFTGSTAAETLIERLIWLAAAAYICCAAIRLARFNVENEEDESAHMSFVGLPSPAAAGVIVSIIIFHQDTLGELLSESSGLYVFCESILIYALPLWSLGMAVLMVSRIRYSHVINQYTKGKKTFAHLIVILVFLVLAIWILQTSLLLIFSAFAASGFVRWLYYKVLRKGYLGRWEHEKEPQPASSAD